MGSEMCIRDSLGTEGDVAIPVPSSLPDVAGPDEAPVLRRSSRVVKPVDRLNL